MVVILKMNAKVRAYKNTVKANINNYIIIYSYKYLTYYCNEIQSIYNNIFYTWGGWYTADV